MYGISNKVKIICIVSMAIEKNKFPSYAVSFNGKYDKNPTINPLYT